ncbi:MAG: PIN domain-containing protein [Dehalococcoidia bacterium]
MNLLLDTDTVIEILRGNPKALHRLGSVSAGIDVCASAITAAELYHGAARSANPATSTQQVALLLSGLQVIPVDQPIAAEFGALKASLQAAGQVIADFDLLIAAAALLHRLQLITHNTRHFHRIPNPALDDWLA